MEQLLGFSDLDLLKCKHITHKKNFNENECSHPLA